MLPILSVKDSLIETIRSNSVTVIQGSTGSGKTTELPVLLAQAGFVKTGSLIVTEPRRAAAINVADYVAQKMRQPLGKNIGYRVRFENIGDKNTPIQFVTAGIVLREMLKNPLLLGCSTLVIDEAHENNIESDLLMSLARDVIKKRQDFRLIIMSATMDVSGYSSFFGGAPVVEIPGRMYPIITNYLERDPVYVEQVIDEAVNTAMGIIQKDSPGDILIFMPGRESIEAVIDSITLKAGRNVIALPLYRDLESVEQKKIYQSFPGQRKVVVSTNIAETSVTIDNIRYVIDSGLIKNIAYLNGVQCLLVEKHSQSGCDQRSGRSGRVGPGICYRLFTEKSFKDRPLYSSPEIERANPEESLLYLQDSGRNIRTFDLINRPSDEAISYAEDGLVRLGALSSMNKAITPLGKRLASMPVEPQVGVLILESIKRGCVKEVLTFVSFLSRTCVFLRPYGKADEAEKIHAQFLEPKSDALTMLKVWEKYVESGYSRNWCRANFINIQAVEEAKRVRDQLARVLLRWKVTISSGSEEVFLKCIVAGFRPNLLKWDGKAYRGIFKNIDDVSLIPQSALRSVNPEYIVASDLLKTKKCYALYATEAKVEWLLESIPNLDGLIASLSTRQRSVKKSADKNGKKQSVCQAASIVSCSNPQLVTLAFKQEGDKYVTEYQGERILKTKKGGKVEVDKPYQCRIIELLGINFAEVVFSGPVEKSIENGELLGMAEELATTWGCHFKGD